MSSVMASFERAIDNDLVVRRSIAPIEGLDSAVMHWLTHVSIGALESGQ